MKTSIKKLTIESKITTPGKNFSNANANVWNSKRRYRL